MSVCANTSHRYIFMVAIGFLVFFSLGILAFLGVFHRSSLLFSQAQKIPFYFQSAPETCGPASLLSICRFYGIDTTEKQIVSLAGTDQAGTSFLGLAQAADFLGLEATGMELSPEELRTVGKPLIAHLNGRHFVIVVSLHKDYLTLIDPASGVRSVSFVDFCRGWEGNVLLLEPKN